MTDIKKAVNLINNNNYDKALNIILPMARDGNASAQFYLGSFYFFGLGVIKNQKEAERKTKPPSWHRL